jgi:hypothetical protein
VDRPCQAESCSSQVAWGMLVDQTAESMRVSVMLV